MRAGDGGAHALGVVDDGLALVAEPVDELADARLVLGIGALDLTDFAVDKRLQFHRASERALDAFAHSGDFAAYGLADHHDTVLRQVLRLGEAEGDLGHGLRGDAHVLCTAHHGCEGPEQHDRHDGRDGDADQFRPGEELVERANLPDGRTKQHMRQGRRAGDPDHGNERDDPVDRVGGAPVERMQKRPVVLLAVVVGGREGGGRRGAVAARLGRAQFRRLGLSCRLIGRCCRLRGRGGGLFRAAGARQFLGGLRNLRFQVFHRGGDVEIAALRGKIHVQSFFELLCHVVIEGLCRRGFLRHAFATLYWLPRDLLLFFLAPRPRLIWTPRIVVTQVGKENMHSAAYVKL